MERETTDGVADDIGTEIRPDEMMSSEVQGKSLITSPNLESASTGSGSIEKAFRSILPEASKLLEKVILAELTLYPDLTSPVPIRSPVPVPPSLGKRMHFWGR